MTNYIETLDVRELRMSIRSWLKLLAGREFAEAAEFLYPLPDHSWSGEQIKTALGRYSRRYRNAPENQKDAFLPSVTDPEQMEQGGENMVIYTRASFGILAIEYDVPIDGKWSDLTASFVVVEDGTKFALGLKDLHVL